MHDSIALTRSIGVDENVIFNLEFSGLLDPTPSEDSSSSRKLIPAKRHYEANELDTRFEEVGTRVHKARAFSEEQKAVLDMLGQARIAVEAARDIVTAVGEVSDVLSSAEQPKTNLFMKVHNHFKAVTTGLGILFKVQSSPSLTMNDVSDGP